MRLGWWLWGRRALAGLACVGLAASCSGDDGGSTTGFTGGTAPTTMTTTSTTSASTSSTSDGTTTASDTDETTGAPASCGDGVVDDGEECDDGNGEDGDACTNACTLAICGDGIVGPGEGCDDGDDIHDDECSNDCASASCGDGVVGPAEECDDGNDADDDACLSTCVNASCGDGFVYAGVEDCDDGNDDPEDACVECVAAACGDGHVQAGVEACDDGNDVETDACLPDCTANVCGDMIVNEGVEDCDDGNDVDTDDCVMCKAAACGDGFVQEGVEACDDGNDVDDDECDNSCQLGAKASCKEVLTLNPAAESGVYTLDPDGDGPSEPFEAYCDMTTDGGGWTLILNRNVNSDNSGQPDINIPHGTFDNTRATNWNHDVDLFWGDAAEFAFADRENDNCGDCEISDYDSAILSPKPNVATYSPNCTSTSAALTVKKLVGPSAGQSGTGYQCAASLGWGNCNGKVCHYGTHYQNTSSNGSWSANQWNEMHFPSTYSSYASYGNYQSEGTAWCRSCGGGLSPLLNQSSTCCKQSNVNNAKSRWTIWVR